MLPRTDLWGVTEGSQRTCDMEHISKQDWGRVLLCLAHREHPEQAHLCETAGWKKITHPLLARSRSLPPPLWYKEAEILTWRRWFFKTLVCCLLYLLSFLMKFLFVAPKPCRSIALSCGKHYELGLSNRLGQVNWLSEKE